MRITRIEIEDRAGHLTIERTPGSATFRIDSMIHDPKPKQQAWKTWELPVTISNEDLFQVAIEVQHRTHGSPGTNSMVHDYYNELQRFKD